MKNKVELLKLKKVNIPTMDEQISHAKNKSNSEQAELKLLSFATFIKSSAYQAK